MPLTSLCILANWCNFLLHIWTTLELELLFSVPSRYSPSRILIQEKLVEVTRHHCRRLTAMLDCTGGKLLLRTVLYSVSQEYEFIYLFQEVYKCLSLVKIIWEGKKLHLWYSSYYFPSNSRFLLFSMRDLPAFLRTKSFLPFSPSNSSPYSSNYLFTSQLQELQYL